MPRNLVADKSSRFGLSVGGVVRTQLFLLAGIILLLVVQEVTRPGSVTLGQFMNVSRQAAGLGVVVLGQTLVIISGGIDLSVGSVVTLTNVFSVAHMAGQNAKTLPAILFCLFLGIVVGAVNAFGVVVLGIAPFVMTLCTMSVIQGIYLVYTGGSPTGSVSPIFKQIGNGSLAFVPYSTLFWIVFALVVALVLHKTKFGRSLFAVGNSRVAARLAGISVRKIQALAYVFSSLLAVLGGLLISGYIGATSLSLGDDYLTNSLAAVLIGGTAIEGGRGGVLGGVFGAFFLVLMFSLMTMLSAGQAIKLIVQSVIIIVVVGAQQLTKNKD